MRVRRVSGLLAIVGVLLSYGLLCWENRPLRRSPIICLKGSNAPRGEKCFQLSQDGIGLAPQYIRQDGAAVMITRLPQPAWLSFVPHETPPLIQVRFLPLLAHDVPECRSARGEDRRMYDLHVRGFF
jgi:hypothetical protein